MKTRKRFTKLKFLLAAAVLIIVGILAAIVVPQFTSASTSSDVRGATGEDIIAMRSQIELYKIHHNGDLPGSAADVNFAQALTQATNADGALNLNPTGRRYGPYMRAIPVNTYNGLDTVEIDGILGGGDYGWHFNSKTGKFHADTDKHTGL
jgi:general secretion pathway protein G